MDNKYGDFPPHVADDDELPLLFHWTGDLFRFVVTTDLRVGRSRGDFAPRRVGAPPVDRDRRFGSLSSPHRFDPMEANILMGVGPGGVWPPAVV